MRQLIVYSIVLMMSASGWAAVNQDSTGWTVVTPSADSRIIYVSDSQGNDLNDGLSQSSPKKTIAAGRDLLRDGYPDHLLLKKGDTFTNQRFGNSWSLSGRSASEPMMIGTYGTGDRPRVLTGSENGLALNIGDSPVRYLVIEGIYLEPHTRDPADAVSGLSIWNTGGTDIIIENNDINGFGGAMRIKGSSVRLERISVRRNIIRNSYNLKSVEGISGSHSQGIFANYIDGFLIEENIFDHNGWHDSIPRGEGTKFNHNMYLTGSKELTNVTVRGNFVSRGSNMGLKFQPYNGHHVIENNLFVRNGYGFQMGGGVPQNYPSFASNGFTVEARNNIVTENQSNGAASTIGYTFAHIASGLFQNNIVANSISDVNFYSMYITDGNGWECEGIGVRNLVIDNNIVYNWTGRALNIDTPREGTPLPDNQNIMFSNNHLQLTRPGNTESIVQFKTQEDLNDFTFANNKYHQEHRSGDEWFRVQGVYYDLDGWMAESGETGAVVEEVDYPEPDRDTQTYYEAMGLNSYDEFIAEMVKQSKDNWRPQFTASAINDYIRAGFGRGSEVPPPPPLPTPPPNPDPPAPPSEAVLPTLPQETVDTNIDPTYDRPADIIVNEGDDLQAALDIVLPGQIIEIEAGKIFTGNFVLKAHPSSDERWIYIRSSAHNQLPEPGNRVNPTDHLEFMPRLISTNRNPVIRSDYGAHHYRLIGLEITTTHATTESNYTDLIMLGRQNNVKATEFEQLPHHLIFDRMYFHGTPTGNVENAIRIDARHLAVMDSYFTDFQFVGRDGGYGLKAYNGPGPFKIVNNFFEVAGINILFGGGAPTVPGVFAADVLISGNYFTKKLFWKDSNEWNVKNLFELKNAQRVHIVGNVFENSWVRGQTGEAIVLSVRNSGGIPSRVDDITIENNIIRDVGRAISIAGEDSNAGAVPSFQSKRIFITNNLFHDVRSDFNPNPRFIQTNTGHDQRRPVLDLTITHNTMLFKDAEVGNSIMFNEKNPGVENLFMENNIMTNGTYGVFQWATTNINPNLNKNVLVWVDPQNPPDQNDFESTYTSENFKADRPVDVGFVNYAGGNFRLTPTSPYKNQATNGRDIGVDMDALLAATLCVEAGTCAAPPDEPDDPEDPEDPEEPGSDPNLESEKKDEDQKFRNIVSAEYGNSVDIPCDNQITIYDRMGNHLKSIPCSGEYATWNGENEPSGVYYVREGEKELRKVVVIK